MRIGQIATLVFCVFLLGVAWKNSNVLLGAAALGVFGFAVFDVVSPPQKRLEKKIAALRKRGVYPPEDRLANENDVRKLAHCGEKILAVELYQKLHDVSLRDAKNAVERMK